MDNICNLKDFYSYSMTETLPDYISDLFEVSDDFYEDLATRLSCNLNMKHIDTQEIEHIGEGITRAKEQMEKELGQLRKYEKNFNDEFANDHNEYFRSANESLERAESKLMPLKTLLIKFCDHKQSNIEEPEFSLNPNQSAIGNMELASENRQTGSFSITGYPIEVQRLFADMKDLFRAEAECKKICTDILVDEERIMKDQVQCKYLLDRCRQKTAEKLKSMIVLISDDIVDNLKSLNPTYQKLQEYASEEEFAQGEFHKHNTAIMDHFCLIELVEKDHGITKEEKENWGDDLTLIKMVRYVIKHFNELLPKNFRHKEMGYYQYLFCLWALPRNIKRGTKYFINHYKGPHKVCKYAAVSKQSVKYLRDSKDSKDFKERLKSLLLQFNPAEFSTQNAEE